MSSDHNIDKSSALLQFIVDTLPINIGNKHWLVQKPDSVEYQIIIIYLSVI